MRGWPRALTCTNCCKGCAITIALLICLGSLKALPLTLYVYNATTREARENPTSRWVPQPADSDRHLAESDQNIAESVPNVAESHGNLAESDRHADVDKPRQKPPCWGVFCWLARRQDGRLDTEGFGGDPGYIGWTGPTWDDAPSVSDDDAFQRGSTGHGKTEPTQHRASQTGSASNGRTGPTHHAASQRDGPRPTHLDRGRAKGVTRVGDDTPGGTVQQKAVRHRARDDRRGASGGRPHADTGETNRGDSVDGHTMNGGAEASTIWVDSADAQGINAGAEGSGGEQMMVDSAGGQEIMGEAQVSAGEKTTDDADGGQGINGGAGTPGLRHARGQRDGLAGERGKGREKGERNSGRDAARGAGHKNSSVNNNDDKEEAKRRCAGTRGGWCEAFLLQTPIPTRVSCPPFPVALSLSLLVTSPLVLSLPPPPFV
jgi:hypothetical protein